MAPATTPSAVTVELSLELKRRVEWFMRRTLQSLSAKAGEKVKLICGHSISRAVLEELPGSTLSWRFNTEPLTMDPSRTFFYKGNLDITDLVPSDSGVYECMVTWGTDDTVKQNLTLGVFSLEIETDTPTRYVFENEPTRMDCHSATLGSLFPDAIRYWLYNGTHTSVLPVTKASNGTPDVIASMHKSMAGVWECQVMEMRTERVWAPAWYNLSVQDPPSGAARVFRHLQVHWYTVLVVLTVLLVACVLLFCFSAYKMKKIEDEAGDKFLDERQGWEDTLLRHSENGKVNVESLTPAPTPSPSDSPSLSGTLSLLRDSTSLNDLRAATARGGGSDDADENDENGDGENLGYNNDVGDATGNNDRWYGRRRGDDEDDSDDSDNREDIEIHVDGFDDVTKNATWNRHNEGLRKESSIGINFSDEKKVYKLLQSGRVEDMNVNKSAYRKRGAEKRNDFFQAQPLRNKRMAKLGKMVLAKTRNKNVSPATRQDVFMWLERHSLAAKQPQWRSVKTHASLKGTNPHDTKSISSAVRGNSNASNVNRTPVPKAHITPTSGEFEWQSSRCYGEGQDCYDQNVKPLRIEQELSSKRKNSSSRERIGKKCTFQRQHAEKRAGKKYISRAAWQHTAMGPNNVYDFSEVDEDTDPSRIINNSSPTFNEPVFPEKSLSSSKTSWKSWLVSKFSRGNYFFSKSSSRNGPSLWLNHEVRYTALPQTEA